MSNLEALLEFATHIKEVKIPETLYLRAYCDNEWFDKTSIDTSFEAICTQMLDSENLREFAEHYNLNSCNQQGSVAIIMAGNIPFVGFADLVYALLSGYKVYVKFASKDFSCMEWITAELNHFLEHKIELYSNQKCDRVIATGSNNSNRYFSYSFEGVKSLFRSSRSSIAVVCGDESSEELKALHSDIFQFYGQGCRNVSTLLISNKFSIKQLLEEWKGLKLENLHFNNCYKRCRAINIMNSAPFIDGGYFLAVEKSSLHIDIAQINYFYYSSIEEVEDFISQNKNQLQCVVASPESELSNRLKSVVDGNIIPFGKAQMPSLYDFADNIDVIEFLK